jgi:hypothetical protein
MNGDFVNEETYPLNSGINELKLNVDDLTKGAFMVQFYTNEGSAVRRFIKMY